MCEATVVYHLQLEDMVATEIDAGRVELVWIYLFLFVFIFFYYYFIF